jgi:superfamily I DNA and/or RNA helicase
MLDAVYVDAKKTKSIIAIMCTTLAKKIFDQIPDCKIGIITPYAHQARLINKIAKDW